MLEHFLLYCIVSHVGENLRMLAEGSDLQIEEFLIEIFQCCLKTFLNPLIQANILTFKHKGHTTSLKQSKVFILF